MPRSALRPRLLESGPAEIHPTRSWVYASSAPNKRSLLIRVDRKRQWDRGAAFRKPPLCEWPITASTVRLQDVVGAM